jgi:hypothetical protein
MGATRQFRAGRRGKVLSQKQKIKSLNAEAGYLRGLAMRLAAENEALKMKRPADLEDWVNEVLDDLSPEERAEFDGFSAEEREAFLDQLGQRINVSKAVLGVADPEPASSGS